MNGKKRVVLSVVVGLVLMVLSLPFMGRMPMVGAWWGILYPQYCYSQMPRETDETVEIKIKCKWIHGFDEI